MTSYLFGIDAIYGVMTLSDPHLNLDMYAMNNCPLKLHGPTCRHSSFPASGDWWCEISCVTSI